MSWRGLLLKREFFGEKTANGLSVLAVTLGVGLIVATATTVSSTKREFLQMAGASSSGADLIATSVADQEVGRAVFSYQDTSLADSIPYFSEDSYYENGGTYHTLTLIAADFDGENRHGGFRLLSGNLPENNECLITEAMESQYHLAIGDSLPVRTNGGSLIYRVSGIVQNGGIASDNFYQCLLTDIRDYSGCGTMTYKLMLRPGTDVKAEKASLQAALSGSYTVDYPAGKAEKFLAEADSLFDLMMGFGFLTLLLGGFLMNVTVHEFVRKMRPKFSTLKVLGAKRPSLVLLVLEKSLLTGTLGTAFGTALGAFGSLGLLRLVDRSFNGGGMAIPVSFPSVEITAAAAGAVLLCLLFSLPASLQATKESILSGFRQYDRENAVGRKRRIAAAVLFLLLAAARLLLGSTPIGKLITFAALAAGIYFTAAVAFLPCARLLLRPVCRISPFNGFTVKNNLVKQSGRAVHLAVLFSFVIALSVGVYTLVAEIGDTTDRLEKGLYYGDAVVSSVTGQGIGSDLLQKIEEADGVDSAYPLYQKYLNLGGDSVQMKGYRLDDTTLLEFADNWGIDREEARMLSGESTVILSRQVMDDLNRKVGDTVSIGTDAGTETFRIVGTYETLNNNGITGILSEDTFLKIFKNYTIRAVDVFQKSGTDFETLKSGILKSADDSFIQVQSVDAVRSSEKRSDDRFLALIDCMIVVLVAAGSLILINSLSMNIQNNGCSLAVTRLLGATNRNQVFQGATEGLLYGIFGVAVGETAGTLLGRIMTAGMNGMSGWNLRFIVSPLMLLAFGIGFLGVAVFAEMTATALNYRNDWKAALAQE